MRRWTQLLIALAILIAAQPLVHSHATVAPGGMDDPAISSYSAAPCAVCATANARVTVSAPSVPMALNVVEELTAPPASGTVTRPTSSLSSRAPPAA